ncbi:hypothetical protein BCR41DRAFT_109424 [Lobosporangium transversale]|uniref:Uncharacterized protein n=1 Tax=Lobosporangium transversale TaxID=64571 RepID=A0A1Y2GHB6_9FUNG|nr:hypothetical protein BCR41DRAFT_113871 [Lobosporangium transversale]XP_021879861.1 hypothetical protein BCR41DRAFT_109424 [Lobosporangium transversale]ORZ10930.1 hypothetical protein BCR41DRAFT_113871 [Lobosporangium transversale]ORZ11764.1 hypothetical protein BCR41DRAFT_109424 [Lobosporangium transversale]|eukprot:XP_021879447.1 hypothetical protein BCR41DRAFT_113871 [Lobosporangium transversale]
MDASQHRSLSDTNINNDRVQRSSGLERVATGHIRGGPPPLNRPGGPASRSRRYVPPRRRGPVRQSEGMTPADQRSPGAATTALLANTQTHASSVSSHDLENTDTLSLPVLRTMAPVSGEGNIRDMSPLSAPRPHSPSTEVPVAAPVTVSVISGPLPSASLTFFGATAMVEIADVTEEVLASADTSQASAGSELQVNPSSLATPILTSTVVVPTPLPPPSSPTSSLLRTSINARPLPSVQHVQVNDGYEGERRIRSWHTN